MAAIQALNIVLEINLLQHILSGASQLAAKSVPMQASISKSYQTNACLAHDVYLFFDLGQSIPVHC
jgi:hypothetical protein